MKVSNLFLRGSGASLFIGAAMLCSVGSLGAAEGTAPATWPRFCTVDDDDVVIYQPKVEKWDQKSVEVRFSMSIKGKNDDKPIYGSFLARAETAVDPVTHMVSISNVKEEDFKFPNAEKRIDHIKRDIAAVSPEKPLSLPTEDLVVSAPTGDVVNEESIASVDNVEESTEPASKIKKITTHHPVSLHTKKSAIPQLASLPGDDEKAEKSDDDNSTTNTTPEHDDAPVVVQKEDSPPATKHHVTKDKEDDVPAVVHRRVSKDDDSPAPVVKHHVSKDDDLPVAKAHVVKDDSDDQNSPPEEPKTHVRHVRVVTPVVGPHLVIVKRGPRIEVVHHVHHKVLVRVAP